MYVGGRPTDWTDALGLYEGSKIPDCVPMGPAKIRTERQNLHKKEDDYDYRWRLREVHPSIGIGPESSRNPRLVPSWGVEYVGWKQRQLISLSWTGYTLSTFREQRYRCEARWRTECGKEEVFVSWHTSSKLISRLTYWGEPTRYIYDWEWVGFAGEANFPGT